MFSIFCTQVIYIKKKVFLKIAVLNRRSKFSDIILEKKKSEINFKQSFFLS